MNLDIFGNQENATMKFKFASILSIVIIIAACNSTKNVAAGQSDVERGAKLYPGYSLAKLNQGRILYEGNCGSCHGLYKSTDESAESWGMIVPRMVKKTNKKAGAQVINQDQETLILQYLVTMSTAPKQ